MKNKYIRPGKKWRDNDNKPIQAHGLSIIQMGDKYFWYGENKEFSKKGKYIYTYGVRLYVSDDFLNWEDKGLIVPPSSDLNCPLHPTYCLDRPHIIYCEKTKKFVLWMKIMSGVISQFMCIMTSSKLEGPYEFVHKMYKPLDMDSGDFCFHVDEKTKKAYIWFERPHFELICATLSDDYTSCTGEYSVHYENQRPPFAREAPVFFERNGKKYLFTSGTTGYYPNKTQVCVFDEYHDEYKDLGNPCVGKNSDTTFNSQISCVIKIEKTGQYVALADQWIVGPFAHLRAKIAEKKFNKAFEKYIPDRSKKEITPLSNKLQKNFASTYKSRYVFLPIDWDEDKPIIRFKKKWKI